MPRAPFSRTEPAAGGVIYSARRRFSITPREPLHLPEQKIELPAPPQAPPAPAPVNLLTALLVPGLMLIASLAVFLIGQATGQSGASWVSLIMLLPTMAFPLVNVLNANSAKKNYLAALQKREQEYRGRLQKICEQLEALAEEQRSALQAEYPAPAGLAKISAEQGARLWWRRPADTDFLYLRLGEGEDRPSFSVAPARVYDSSDPLSALPEQVLRQFERLRGLPLLLPLGRVGSAALSGRNVSRVHALARRLVLDLLVHHSPRDVQVVVLADARDAIGRWEWLKWVPHTAALDPAEEVRFLAFTPPQTARCVEWLIAEYKRREGLRNSFQVRTLDRGPAIVVIFDDERVRRREEVAILAEQGGEVGIYLLFVAGDLPPRECRAKVELRGEDEFRYIETLPGESKGIEFTGRPEFCSLEECERVARDLAGLEVAGRKIGAHLPETVRLSQVVGGRLDAAAVREAWAANARNDRLLRFPIGLQVTPDGLQPAVVDFLPEDYGGGNNYHLGMIGTTGSGKSEFMKSLVLGGALKYSPRELTFFFMDFKGGTAFEIFAELPHTTGYVTNLDRPDLVVRGLTAIASEIERRQARFKALGGKKNIWEYNADPSAPAKMSHLVIMLDEFTRGLAEFPQLRGILETLVRQGRALGMYLILANQDLNAEIEKLKANIGWWVALKLARPEDMEIIDRSLRPTTRRGHGYVRSLKGEIIEFQAGYAGYSLLDENAAASEELVIYALQPDGSLGEALYRQTTPDHQSDQPVLHSISEEVHYLQIIRQAALEQKLRASPIYLEPLPTEIPLSAVFTDPELPLPPRFSDACWDLEQTPAPSLLAPIGFLDCPQECRRSLLTVNFRERDGHLWLVGAPGSGKDLTLTTLLLSLAQLYTPAEVQFYILEYSAEAIFHLEGLPHVGAIIRLQERERLQRLLAYLEAEMERRSTLIGRGESVVGLPAIFLVINNYAELRANYPDENDRLARFARGGKAVGIHLVVTTNRAIELMRSVAITRRLVFELTNRDEYLDLVGRNVTPPGVRAPGRGLWVDEQISECQIAHVPAAEVRELVNAMRSEWKGKLPAPIRVLPACVPLSDLSSNLPLQKEGVLLPVGLAHDNLSSVIVDLRQEIPHWLILGPRESGKSNFLLCAALACLRAGHDHWRIHAVSLRHSPLRQLAATVGRAAVWDTTDQALAGLSRLVEELKTPASGAPGLLLLLDDLGALHDVGPLQAVLAALAAVLPSRQDVVLMGAGLFDEVRQFLTAPLVRLLKQSRTGVVFSREAGELDWLGAALSLEQRRVELPPGRGFFVSRGKARLVQTPLAGKCPQGDVS